MADDANDSYGASVSSTMLRDSDPGINVIFLCRWEWRTPEGEALVIALPLLAMR